MEMKKYYALHAHYCININIIANECGHMDGWMSRQ